MKWKTKDYFPVGTIRYRKVFTWLPTKIYNEVYWFELVNIKERYCHDNEYTKIDKYGNLHKYYTYKWVITGLDDRQINE